MKIHLKVTTKKDDGETENDYQRKKIKLMSDEVFTKIDAFHNELVKIAEGD